MRDFKHNRNSKGFSSYWKTLDFNVFRNIRVQKGSYGSRKTIKKMEKQGKTGKFIKAGSEHPD